MGCSPTWDKIWQNCRARGRRDLISARLGEKKSKVEAEWKWEMKSIYSVFWTIWSNHFPTILHNTIGPQGFFPFFVSSLERWQSMLKERQSRNPVEALSTLKVGIHSFCRTKWNYQTMKLLFSLLVQGEHQLYNITNTYSLHMLIPDKTQKFTWKSRLYFYIFALAWLNIRNVPIDWGKTFLEKTILIFL